MATADKKFCKVHSWLSLCSECGHCHLCGAVPRTQKAKGLKHLEEFESFVPVLKILHLIQKDEDLSCVENNYKCLLPVFVRPCPPTPKHGYIDSRVVSTTKQLRDLWEIVKADNPESEMMITPYIKADFNMVVTENLIVVGPGHDGATAGKDTISIPVAKSMMPSADLLKKSGVKKDDWPYFEVVGMMTPQGPNLTLTQLRAGPKLESALGNFIPCQTTVKKVIKADPSLYKDREWEVLIEGIKDEAGVVVWHPGGALTDHFSVHSRTYAIPVVYDAEEPAVGSVLEPVSEAPIDPQAVLEGIVWGEKMPLWHSPGNGYGRGGITESAVAALLYGLHHSAALTGDASRWIGVAAALMCRIGTIALRGEARHLGGLPFSKLAREEVYKRGYNISLKRLRSVLPGMINIHRYGDFGGGGVGGPKWAACGKSLIPIYQGIKDLAQNPTVENVQILIRALNVAVNQAHNGGWWLNKFTSESMFDYVQKGQMNAILRAAVGFWYAAQTGDTLAPSTIKRSISTYADWPDTTLVPLKVKSVDMFSRDGVAGLEFRLSTQLRGRMKTIRTDIKTVNEALNKVFADVYLVGDPKGTLRIEARGENGKTTTLWQETDLDEVMMNSLKNHGAGDDDDAEPEPDDDIPF